MAKKSYETYNTLGEQIDNDSKSVAYDPNRDYSHDLKQQIASGADYNTVYKTLAARINKADNTEGLSQYAWDSTTRDAINYLLSFHETPDTYIDAAEAAEETRRYNQDVAAGVPTESLADRVAALAKPMEGRGPSSITTTAQKQTEAVSKPATTPSATTTVPAGSSSSSASSNDYSDYLEEMYKAQKEAGLAALKAAYDKNVSTVDAAGNRIPGVYNAARNQTAATAAQTQRNFNQQAAAAGLGSGTSAQAQLANSVTLQNNLNALNEAEASALAELELQRTNLSTEYENAVAQAEANGNYELAAALYEEAVRMDEQLAAQEAAFQKQMAEQEAAAAKQAEQEYKNGLEMAKYLYQNSGDASGLKAYGYTDDQIAGLEAQWRAKNVKTAGGDSGNDDDLGGFWQQAIDNGVTPTQVQQVTTNANDLVDRMLGGGQQIESGGLYNSLIGSTPVQSGIDPDNFDIVLKTIESYLSSGRTSDAKNYMSSTAGRMNEEQFRNAEQLFTMFGV